MAEAPSRELDPKTLTYAFVRCPRCDRRATVFERPETLRLACKACGYVRDAARARFISFHACNRTRQVVGADLWLQATCCGNTLWALNDLHLDYIEAYVAEKQREREFPSPPGARQLAYKLPRWMKAQQNREEVVRVTKRLRARL